MTTWRDIKTAPYGGQFVLLYSSSNKDIYIGCYLKNTAMNRYLYQNMDDEAEFEEGWYLADDPNARLLDDITHWMPLPERPE